MNSGKATQPEFTSWRFAVASWRHYPRLMIPIALGISAATATILGALLVGDSLRGSLRFLAMDRIGKIDYLMLAPNFFSQELAPTKDESTRVQPAIIFPSTSLELRTNGDLRRASGVLTLAVTSEFWQLGDLSKPPAIEENQIAINEATARELQAKVGDQITLQVPAPAAVSADSPLGKRDSETVTIANLEVTAILPNKSLARFDLQSNQRASLNAFISPLTIQKALSRPDEFNSLIYSDTKESTSSLPDAQKVAQELLARLQPTLSDLGFRLDRHRDPTAIKPPAFDYYQLTSDRMLLPPAVVQELSAVFPADKQTVIITYLANAIRKTDNPDAPTVVYSTIAGVAPEALGSNAANWQLHSDTLDLDHPLRDDECLINSWLAEQGELAVGDKIEIAYYQSENEDGREVERTFEVTVAGIVPLTKPAQPYRRNRDAQFADAPTAFNDPALTPTVAGITDQDSISDWDTPFPLEREVTDADDEYWEYYRLTPKVYLSLDRAQMLFGSRFGTATSVRFAPELIEQDTAFVSKLTRVITSKSTALGWNLIPIRAQQLTAASGTTPFDGLFLALSFFVIFSSLILIFLLMRLSVESRSSQWGILKAIGWNEKRIRRLIAIESSFIIAAGCGAGVFLGVMFCKVILDLLRNQWVGAVGVPFLQFHWTWLSIILGIVVGAVCAWSTIRVSLLHLAKRNSVELLHGSSAHTNTRRNQRFALMRWGAAWICLVATISLPMLAGSLQGPAKAGAFLVAGMALLVALLMLFYNIAIAGGYAEDRSATQTSTFAFTLRQLATSSIQRNSLRSVLAVCLIAVACFLLLSVSLFHVEPDRLGTGGFSLIAQSDLPIARDIAAKDVQEAALGENASILADTQIVGMRYRGGDDAGCSNLYQANEPRILGVSRSMSQIDQGSDNAASQFAWAGQIPLAEGESIWKALDKPADGSESSPLPVIVDQNTAMWGLHLKSSVGEVFSYRYDGRDVYFQTVGLPQNTILQGFLLIGEANFKKLFPEISGQRYFLVKSAPNVTTDAANALERGWANEGLDVRQAETVLRDLLAVQNTYLSAFQSLGTLGLLLGTLGLAVVQIRSVVERRSEFGLMRAMGFDTQRLVRTLLTEHLALLAGGTIIGGASALLAVAFAWVNGQTFGAVGWPLLMLVLVFAVGMLAGLFAISKAVRIPVLQALRTQ